MTKMLASFAASRASTSTVPRLLFKRNQLEPEISRKVVTGFLATVTSGRCCPTGKIAAIGHLIMLIPMPPFDELAFELHDDLTVSLLQARLIELNLPIDVEIGTRD